MSAMLADQAARLYSRFSELVRSYQFRDRDQICCYGISVSQCYTLDALADRESMTMGELAQHLGLKISTATRVVDHLVEAGYATRAGDASDRRICRIRITRKGRGCVSRIRGDLVKEYEQVLSRIEPGSREAVITAVSHLLEAFKNRPCPTECAEAPCGPGAAGAACCS